MYNKDYQTNDYSNLHLSQIKHLWRQFDARATQVEHTATMHKWLQRENIHNYKHQYDRTRGEVSHYVLPFVTIYKLTARRTYL